MILGQLTTRRNDYCRCSEVEVFRDREVERVELAGFAIVLEEHFVVLDCRMLAADCSWRAERDREAYVPDTILFWRCIRLDVQEIILPRPLWMPRVRPSVAAFGRSNGSAASKSRLGMPDPPPCKGGGMKNLTSDP